MKNYLFFALVALSLSSCSECHDNSSRNGYSTPYYNNSQPYNNGGYSNGSYNNNSNYRPSNSNTYSRSNGYNSGSTYRSNTTSTPKKSNSFFSGTSSNRSGGYSKPKVSSSPSRRRK